MRDAHGAAGLLWTVLAFAVKQCVVKKVRITVYHRAWMCCYCIPAKCVMDVMTVLYVQC